MFNDDLRGTSRMNNELSSTEISQKRKLVKFTGKFQVLVKFTAEIGEISGFPVVYSKN